jgi:hypothetical protein
MAQGSSLHVRCAIAGGGPAGMMLGLLLARAGLPLVRRLPAYFVGIGFRPEHVQTADAFAGGDHESDRNSY